MTPAAGGTTLADLPEDVREALLEDEPASALQLFPPLDDRDLEELTESVRARGIRVPLEVDSEGQLLDGHHRLQVARELGLPPEEIPVAVREDLDDEEDILEYVLEVNLGRRHLTPEDRAQVAAALRRRGWSLRRIADRVGVGKSTIARDLSGSGVPNGTAESEQGPPDRVRGRDGKTYPASSSSTPPADGSDDGDTGDGGGRGGPSRRPRAAQGRNGSEGGRARSSSSGSSSSEGRRGRAGAADGSDEGEAGDRSRSSEPGVGHSSDGRRRPRKTGSQTSEGGTDLRLASLQQAREALEAAAADTGRGESEVRVEIERLIRRVEALEDRIRNPDPADGPEATGPGPSLQERARSAWEDVLEALENDAEEFVEEQLPDPGREALETVGGWGRLREAPRRRLQAELRVRFVSEFIDAAGREDDRPAEVVL